MHAHEKGLMFYSAHVKRALFDAVWRYCIAKWTTTFLFLNFMAYPTVLRYTLSLHVCHFTDQSEEVEWLVADWMVPCYTESHKKWRWGLGVFGLCYVILFPLGWAWYMRSTRTRFAEKLHHVRVMLWTLPYKPHLYLWPLLAVVRVFFIVLFITFVGVDQPDVALAGAAMVGAFSLVVHIHVKPYSLSSCNRLEESAFFLLLVRVWGARACVRRLCGAAHVTHRSTLRALMSRLCGCQGPTTTAWSHATTSAQGTGY